MKRLSPEAWSKLSPEQRRDLRDQQRDSWIAPEHRRLTADMPRNRRTGALVLDCRPAVLRPDRSIRSPAPV